MPLRVGVTSGIYTAARSEELATPIKKLGYVITRGVSAMEIAADVAYEIPYTHGREMRHMAKKQKVDLNLHGDLMVPLCIPERTEWRDAQDRMQKSVRSAVHAGAGYIDFHACLNIWMELMTYAGRKLTSSFVDHEGKFISNILSESEPLREWFIKFKLRQGGFTRNILSSDDIQNLNLKQNLLERELEQMKRDLRREEETEKARINQLQMEDKITPGEARFQLEELFNNLKEKENNIQSIEAQRIADEISTLLDNEVRDKLIKGEAWDSEDFRGTETMEGFHIMAHYLFFNKDPMWIEMAKLYKNVLNRYGLDYNDNEWLERAWRSAETENDKEFKEFFYAVVGAKYLEGHIKKLFDWMSGDFKNELAKHDDGKELQDIAKNLVIAIENPDARDPSHAGMFILWRLRQIYAAVKVIRKTLKTDKVAIIVDHEHIASQGLDAWLEVKETAEEIPDFGEYIISVHSNHPNPLHPHEPVELGDVKLYELLWHWRKTGLGKKGTAFLMFERGGGEDPFKRSVEALRMMAKYLEEDVEPEKLPLEFFGLKGPISGMVQRQMQIIRDHAYEPMKDLLEMPEEEWGLLSAEARKKGRAEVWKKAEMR
ncbi:MAG: hypothetical protein ABIF08_02355 [Nanoarchaeota archaeon]